MTEATPGNLSLWEQVSVTDKTHTKDFTRGGGFSGTAINSTYLLRKATEQWGPMGAKWGVEILHEGMLDGAPITSETYAETRDADGNVLSTREETVVIGFERIHYVRIRLWYPTGLEGPKAEGSIEHFGQTTFVGKNKKGTFTDEEAPKKSLTDAIGKALSMLGFSADIYLGTFDDKYAGEQPEARGGNVERKARADTPRAPKATVTAKELTAAKDALKGCKTVVDLRAKFDALPDALRAATEEYAKALAKGLE